MPEVRLPGAGGHDQAVVRELELDAIRAQRRERTAIEVESRHARQRHLGVLLPAKHVADRRRDLALRQDPRGHLVQQRLEQMVVDAVDEGEVHGRALQEPGGEQPPEPAADDDDAMPPADFGLGCFGLSRHGP